MKNILKTIAFISLVCVQVNVNAQDTEKPRKVTRADKAYDNLAYVNAIKTYERVAAKGYKSVDLFQKLGNSYYFNADLKQANKWYTELFALNQPVEAEYYYRYSQTLKSVEDYTKADEYLGKFHKMSGNDIRGNMYNSQKDYKAVIAKNSGRHEIKATSLNTKAYDYGAALYGDKFLFSSSRDTVGPAKRRAIWTGLSFTNLYQATLSEDGTLGKAEKFSRNLNSKFHEDSPVFTKDLQTVYFTRNNYNNGKVQRDEKKVMLLKLYKATLNQDKWENVVEVPFNSNDYSVAHPALSPDEKTLYFATDMPGTTGQSDLYKVAILGDNTYGAPVKLTGGINTEARETFPYITSDNELYFASDGHQGLGGLDVFMTKLDKNGMPGKIINIGSPINGPADDFGYIVDKRTKKGFFTSNRDGGQGLDDIYSFIENKPLEEDCVQALAGVITNSETGAILDNAKVTLYDQNFKELQSMQSDAQGNYNFPVECGKKYYVRGEKDEYETKEASIEIPNKTGKSQLPLATNKKVKEIKVGTDLAKTLEIPIIYFDLDKSFIREDASVELAKVLEVMTENPTMKIDVRSHTDCRQTAAYNAALSTRRVKSTIAWLIQKGIKASRLTGRGYGESQLTNACPCEPTNESSCSEAEHQLNRRSEFIVVSMK
jgi:outer membrane protein OmpA-like peptidoglycan-associated protein